MAAADRTLLVQAAMSGDPAAAVTLLAAVQPDIRRYARRQCRSASDAEDAAQEALIALHRRLGTLRAAEAVSAWLFAVVRHACLKLARAVPFRSASSAGPLADDAQPAAVPLDDLRLDLAAVISSLPEHYREVVVLRDLHERTIDEIAMALNLSREAVKGRLHRARSLLREYLAG